MLASVSPSVSRSARRPAPRSGRTRRSASATIDEPGDERRGRRATGIESTNGNATTVRGTSAGQQRAAAVAGGVVGWTTAVRRCRRPCCRPALSASSTPAAPGWPRCCANAMVTTSNDAEDATEHHQDRDHGTHARNAAARTVRRRGPARTAAARSAAGPAAARSPRRADRRSPAGPVPARPRARPTSPAGGPSTKMTSSRIDSTENAVCRAGVPESAFAHRARTSAPMLGKVAPPSAPSAKSDQAGASMGRRPGEQAPLATTHAATTGGTARDWPYRSTSRGRTRGCAERFRQRRDGRDRAGQPVATGVCRDQQDDGDAEHRDRAAGPRTLPPRRPVPRARPAGRGRVLHARRT